MVLSILIMFVNVQMEVMLQIIQESYKEMDLQTDQVTDLLTVLTVQEMEVTEAIQVMDQEIILQLSKLNKIQTMSSMLLVDHGKESLTSDFNSFSVKTDNIMPLSLDNYLTTLEMFPPMFLIMDPPLFWLMLII
jgi:hypothetical protein